MSNLADSILETQNNYEQRFNCVVCLCPKLLNVYGHCQHRLCVDCLYTVEGSLRASMNKCPTCQMENAFPRKRPDIPEDNQEIMRCLGVSACENRGCNVEMWPWELDDHLKTCPNRVATPKTPHRKSRTTSESKKSSKESKTNKESETPRAVTRRSGNVLRRLRSFRRSVAQPHE